MNEIFNSLSGPMQCLTVLFIEVAVFAILFGIGLVCDFLLYLIKSALWPDRYSNE